MARQSISAREKNLKSNPVQNTGGKQTGRWLISKALAGKVEEVLLAEDENGEPLFTDMDATLEGSASVMLAVRDAETNDNCVVYSGKNHPQDYLIVALGAFNQLVSGIEGIRQLPARS